MLLWLCCHRLEARQLTIVVCVQRKTRCDPGLPRCGPCERVKAYCEYYDPARGIKIPRNYVVHLQHRVDELQAQLELLEKDDYQPDPEEIVRGGADIKINKEDDDSKFLGPSSGIAITRLVMQLAKRFTQSDSINDIVAPNQAELAKEAFAQEEPKPTSKVYPIISNVAAPDLPPREMTDVLVKLFNIKGMF
jgi:Fungal Zn(2)-Cys(6) binuclear cluster domain